MNGPTAWLLIDRRYSWDWNIVVTFLIGVGTRGVYRTVEGLLINRGNLLAMDLEDIDINNKQFDEVATLLSQKYTVEKSYITW